VKKIARPPRIAYDEWNVWYRTDDGTLPASLRIGVLRVLRR